MYIIQTFKGSSKNKFAKRCFQNRITIYPRWVSVLLRTPL